ncbi:cryptochrome/photolyase family protein [Azospirillum halopraeferens]|uniref:cryptochrome/photolyase family protein n=1 Tax=Azospirillum halopraeferens TaxID=34010 RepID=UPI000491BA9C|nr:deoxyribodipyrimidine photo-lyase [Azospirillum halopraeferens]
MPTVPNPAPVIVWFRRDLRLADNPALSAAADSGAPVIPLFIAEEDGTDGAASRWWLHGSLEALAAGLQRLGTPLVLRRGDPAAVIRHLVEETGAGTVLWNRRYDPAGVARDRAIKADLRQRGLRAASFNASLLFEPWEVRSATGTPFRVFTPFWRRCLSGPPPAAPLPAPAALIGPPRPVAGDRPEDWGLRPTAPDWAGGLRAAWSPGEAAARAALADFLDGPVATYKSDRDRPDRPATSRLSPHLARGEIGPRQIWQAARMAAGVRPDLAPGVDAFLRELGWREFAHHLLHAFPAMADTPLDPRFAAFPWRDDPAGLRAWQRGRTGFPIVDAGMRQLWRTGWMHNRVRMITASFLVKDLLVPWQAGEAWFRDTLVDADPANNAAGWQWVAGCGADAAPYFRVFNPVLQGEKFDPDGAYVRAHVPELRNLPAAWIHKPWAAPANVLAAAGVRLGTDYPHPILDHPAARDRALLAYEGIKAAGRN